MGASSSRSSGSRRCIAPGTSLFAGKRREETEFGGLTDDKANLRCGNSTLEPSSRPNGTTVSAFMGAGSREPRASKLSIPT